MPFNAVRPAVRCLQSTVARFVRGMIEPLEGRLLLSATITVNAATDTNVPDDKLTLREAILLAAGSLGRA